jgi:hypothetical protein
MGMSMITSTEVITAIQLNHSSNTGHVTVSYPAGTPTVLSVQPDGSIQTRPNGTDGPWEQAIVLSNGNLLYCPLGTTGYVVLGAALKPL